MKVKCTLVLPGFEHSKRLKHVSNYHLTIPIKQQIQLKILFQIKLETDEMLFKQQTKLNVQTRDALSRSINHSNAYIFCTESTSLPSPKAPHNRVDY